MGRTEIDEFFAAIRGQKILVIGDAMLDTYISGEVDRISPEAPVPVVEVKSRTERLGGAANVALNLLAIGAYPVLVTVVGADQAADRLVQVMRDEGLSTEGIINSDSRKTTVKTRIFCRRQQMIRFDDEIKDWLAEGDRKELVDRVGSLAASGTVSAAIFQDYDKGVLQPTVIGELTDMLRNRNILISVDPKRDNFTNYREIDLFKPNAREVAEAIPALAPCLDGELTDLDRLAAHLRDRQKLSTVLITLGDRGLYCSSPEKSALVSAQRRDVADVSGAGDTVIAVATAGMAAGLPAVRWAELANLAGGLVCESVGVAPVDPERLRIEAESL